MYNTITLVISIVGFIATFVVYGISIGKLYQRVETIESRTVKIDDIINNKLEITTKSLNEQTIKIAVLAEKVEQLKEEVTKNVK